MRNIPKEELNLLTSYINVATSKIDYLQVGSARSSYLLEEINKNWSFVSIQKKIKDNNIQ